MSRTLALVVVIVAGGTLVLPGPPARAEDGKAEPEQRAFFEEKVRPILESHCFNCHGPTKQKAGLRLDSRTAMMRGGESGPILEPGDPAASRLIEVIRYDGDTQMPPRRKLDDAEIAVLTRWVKQGAEWPQSAAAAPEPPPVPTRVITSEERAFWAFQPIRDVALPSVIQASWPKTTTDRFILAALEAKGLRPVGPAARRTLIRRATFDLAGVPPTPEEVDAFVADESPGAFERVVDRLLASPHYGERWGRHWLDIARYGEDQAHTFEARLYPHGYRYRDWVINALNNDMPYDQFVVAQIAGDLLEPSAGTSSVPATGLFALGPVYYGGAVLDEYDDRVDTLCRGFLGLTVACARCHDHKFDPITQHDYYALSGVFASTAYKEYPQAPADVVQRYDEAQAKLDKKNSELKRKRRVLMEAKTDADKDAAKAEVKALQAEIDQLKKDMPAKYPFVHGLTEGKTIANMKVHLRGNPATLGAEAPRRFLEVLTKPDDSVPFGQGSGRLELARAIASPENPLTARVLVNRVWERHFGRGLVATPSNFGKMGERPSHPELLDHLASQFIASGWSIKTLHRAIMLSATYQLDSAHDDRCAAVDPENTLLWRANRRRLEVEAWRDAMLAVSGELDESVGGPSADLAAAGNRRRTLYGSVSRHNLDGLLRLFDFPDPNITSDKRTVTTVPLQQLFVLNSPFMQRQARALAARLTADSSESDSSRISRAFQLLYSRDPRAAEMSLALEFLADERPLANPPPTDPPTRWELYAQALLGTNEFTFVD
jgi:mono/diheme cytochrome c family protein